MAEENRHEVRDRLSAALIKSPHSSVRLILNQSSAVSPLHPSRKNYCKLLRNEIARCGLSSCSFWVKTRGKRLTSGRSFHEKNKRTGIGNSCNRFATFRV